MAGARRSGSSSRSTPETLASTSTSTRESQWRCPVGGPTQSPRSAPLRSSGSGTRCQTPCGTTSSVASTRSPRRSSDTPSPWPSAAGTRCVARRPAPGKPAPSCCRSSAASTPRRRRGPWASRWAPRPCRRPRSWRRRASSARRFTWRRGSCPSARRCAPPRSMAASRRSPSCWSSRAGRTSSPPRPAAYWTSSIGASYPWRTSAS
mmetsp:Transcript_88261/g.254567  ORF Transcript_88261/g.254567 Transcript_88261/m.254567 type:complete len:206 (-) Transcript_88261:39-656(-)